MKKVNLNFDLVNLEGIKVATANKIVGGLLMSEMKGDSEKFFDWAVAFGKEQEVSMDATDFERFKDLISKTERLSVMVKVPIVRYLKSIK